MSKERDGRKEAKKKPILTIKEKRAVKKSKKEGTLVSGGGNPTRGPTTISRIGRP